MRSSYRRIGDFIKQVKVKNKDGACDQLLGINIDKYFMPSVANVVGTDLTKYKVVQKNQFACNRMHVGRDNRIPLALSQSSDPFIVSPAYTVFEITNTSELYPEYLMMWFSRAEFDREAWFHTDADVRGGLPWNLFCDIELPVPYIENQREIVKEFNTIVNRIKLNKQLNQKLEETAQALYKHWFVDFEFPNENSRPYRTSGGKMAYNDELDKDVPEGWEIKDCGDLTTIKAGGDKPKIYSSKQTKLCSVPIYSNSMKDQGLFGFTNNAEILEKSITISARGGIGFTSLRVEPYVPIVRLIVVIPKELKHLNYLFHFLTKYEYDDIASAQAQLTIPDVSKFKVAIPPSNLFQDFQSLSEKIYNTISIKRKKNKSLLKLGSVLLSKMSKVESLKAEQVL
jgi:type I restriction enzyme, S subunit